MEILSMAEVVTRDSLAEKLKQKIEEEQGGTFSMAAAREEIRWFFDTISGALQKGDEVRIHGFGAFKTAQRAARMGRNPRTGEAVKVAARRVVRFAPSSSLSASLKGRAPARRAKK
jgi:DNA-binding protein HU-beta